MPNRVIREAILDSEAYHALSVDARCLFFELILNADDYGLVPIGDLYLKRHTPTCEGKSAGAIAGFLEQIATQQMIVIYQIPGGNRFAAILKFGNGPRALKPKWPLPPEPLLSKIKALHEKRIADAAQAHSRRTASAPVTVTVTETVTEKKKEQDPAATELWTFGVEMLARDGRKPLSSDAARSFIGLLLKTWSAAAVLDACQSAVGKDDPKAYLHAVLKKKRTLEDEKADEHYD
jgi:hypothetical protein